MDAAFCCTEQDYVNKCVCNFFKVSTEVKMYSYNEISKLLWRHHDLRACLIHIQFQKRGLLRQCSLLKHLPSIHE